MARHNEGRVVLNQAGKGNQLCLLQFVPCLIGISKSLMAVPLCGPVARKVFGSPIDMVFFQPLHVGLHHLCYQNRIRTKGAVQHNGIVRVGQYVCIRRKVQINSKFFQISSDNRTCLVCPGSIPGLSYFSHGIHLGQIKALVVCDTCHLTAFLVNGEEQWGLVQAGRKFLGFGCHGFKLAGVLQVLGKIDKPAHRVFLQCLVCGFPCLGYGLKAGKGFRGNDKELGRLLLQGHLADDGPDVCVICVFCIGFIR